MSRTPVNACPAPYTLVQIKSLVRDVYRIGRAVPRAVPALDTRVRHLFSLAVSRQRIGFIWVSLAIRYEP